MKPRRRFPFHRQFDSMDCGPACLRMVAEHHGRVVSPRRLRELCRPSRDGVSLRSIAAAAEDLGFRSLPAQLPFESLRDEVSLPAIVHWEGGHFVVVYEIEGDTVRVADPAGGLLNLTPDEFRRSWIPGGRAGDDGIALLLEPTPQLEADSSDDLADRGYFALFGQIVAHLRRYRTYGLQVFASVLAVSLIQLMFPLLTQILVDHGIADRDIGLIWLILIGQVALVGGRTLGEVVRARLLMHVGARVAMAMQASFVRRLTKLPVSFFDTRLSGDIDRRLADYHEIRRLLTRTLTPALAAVVSLVVFGLVLAWYSLLVLAIFVLGTGLYIAWTLAFLPRARQLVHRRLRLEARLHDIVQEILQGIEDLKLYCARHFMTWQWERSQSALFSVNVRELSVDQLQSLGGAFLNELKNIVITLAAALLVVSGDMTLGMLLAVQYIVGQLNGPVTELQEMIRSTDRSRVALERMEDMRRTPTEDEESTGEHPAPEPKGPLTVSNLHFGYDGSGVDVLQGIDLEIPEGRVTAIVGASGSGKTTLIRLLLRFYRPTGGSIRVGDTELDHYGPEMWRRHCAAVLQDGYLFADTIARNIALGADSPDPDRLFAAARVADALDIVESHPLGFHRVVGSRGQGLSGGQRQRLLIARAVYAGPEYLFFDEATNALDAEKERVIIENLRDFFRGRTVVVVAHRLSTVREADQILVLANGRVVERGRHDELAANRGPYYELVKEQLDLGGGA